MSRPLRPDYTNTYHHVVVRGVDGLPIFDSTKKRAVFLDLIKETRTSHDLKLYAFGFLDNHWHGFVRRKNQPMAQFFQIVKARYTKWYNKQFNRTGTLYGGRYFSSIVEEESYFQMVWHYVQSQGVKADLYEKATDDPGSTASFYAGNRRDYSWIDWREALETLQIPGGGLGAQLAEKLNIMESPSELPVRRERDQYFIASDEYVEKYMQIRKERTRQSSRDESPLRWETLLRVAEDLTGRDQEEILSPTKKPDLVKSRAGLAYAARRYGHKTGDEIAEKLDVAPSTVSRMIKRLQENEQGIIDAWDEWATSSNREK